MMAAMTLTPLNVTAIVDSLSPAAAAMFALEVHDSVGSTNDVVRAFLVADDSPLADGSPRVAALAEEQTQGRGRRGPAGTAPQGPISISLWAGAFMGR